MDRTHHTPVSAPIYFTPSALGESPEQAYIATKSDVLGTTSPRFADQPLPGQLIHAALIIGGAGIEELGLPAQTLLVADAWDSPQAAESAIKGRIEPALTGAGRPRPEVLTGVELLGCLGNPDLSGFDPDEAYASVLLWPDYEVNATDLYTAAFARIIDGRPFPEGSGAHLAYRFGNQVITFEIWRNESAFRTNMHDLVMPEVRAVLEKFGARNLPPITIPTTPCGIAIREEVRYCRTA